MLRTIIDTIAALGCMLCVSLLGMLLMIVCSPLYIAAIVQQILTTRTKPA